MKNNKGFSAIALVIILAVLIGGGYAVLKKEKTNNKVPPPVINTDEQIDTANNVNTSGWKTYRNEEYGFELKHPSTRSWISKIVETKEEYFEEGRVVSFWNDESGLFSLYSIKGTSGTDNFNTPGWELSYLKTESGVSVARRVVNSDDPVPNYKYQIYNPATRIQYEFFFAYELATTTMSYSEIEASQEYQLVERTIEKIISTFRFIE